ncbi:hypothetical protein D3C85_1463660 [compost metagenome]
MFRKTFRREDLDLARPDIGLVHDAAHPAIMVDVRMAVDHRDDWALPQVLADKIECSLGCFRGNQGIQHDPTRVALHEGHVGEIEPSHLVNAIGHLEQPVLHGELGVAP